MRPDEIRRLAVSDLTEATCRELVEHGEDLLVERKRQITEPEKFGAVVSSMANALGGWILIGVEDDRTVYGIDLPGDVQSHVGNVLRKAVDPVPPFRAEKLSLSNKEVVALRIFEAAAPVVVKGTGAVYSRDAGGKRPCPESS